MSSCFYNGYRVDDLLLQASLRCLCNNSNLISLACCIGCVNNTCVSTCCCNLV